MQVLDTDPLTAIGTFLDIKSLCLLQSCNQKLDSDLLEVRTTYIKLWEAVIKLADDGVREDYRQDYRQDYRVYAYFGVLSLHGFGIYHPDSCTFHPR